ncbi:hypothetical protein D3H65_28200 [Paraflavitalea soli]|uniref:Lipoprotein n=1 Tax=Paraflavitalea soli TaxID=2315862 RepID=A0A3B7MUQ3_9BACT|nr:hypothetical protein [Paraflavitalea soli]AXY77627.1 hypothetical protein D3H65_28200 [Paraflavitalea soli]
MRFKLLFMLLPFVSVVCFSQTRFVDTISISGYCFFYTSKFHDTYAGPTTSHARLYYFVPASTLHQRPLQEHLMHSFSEELDTVKFLCWGGNLEQRLFKTIDKTVKSWIEQVKGVDLFYPGQQASPFGIEDYRVFISFANIQWLHLRMPAEEAWRYHNLPPTLDGEKAKGREYDVYLPLKVLELEQGIKLKDGNPVHAKKRKKE